MTDYPDPASLREQRLEVLDLDYSANPDALFKRDWDALAEAANRANGELLLHSRLGEVRNEEKELEKDISTAYEQLATLLKDKAEIKALIRELSDQATPEEVAQHLALPRGYESSSPSGSSKYETADFYYEVVNTISRSLDPLKSARRFTGGKTLLHGLKILERRAGTIQDLCTNLHLEDDKKARRTRLLKCVLREKELYGTVTLWDGSAPRSRDTAEQELPAHLSELCSILRQPSTRLAYIDENMGELGDSWKERWKRLCGMQTECGIRPSYSNHRSLSESHRQWLQRP
jgi:hypothetical protein